MEDQIFKYCMIFCFGFAAGWMISCLMILFGIHQQDKEE
jgi:hypothetical protein